MVGCSVTRQVNYVKPSVSDVYDNQTVALVRYDSLADSGQEIQIYCTAVWVGQYAILTANHCVDAIAEDFGAKSAVGLAGQYALKGEFADPFRNPSKTHGAQVVAVDPKHDLALLRAMGDVPMHLVAHLGSGIPDPGDKLTFVGHPGGLYWTHSFGWVAAYRPVFSEVSEFIEGPLLQVSAPIWYGNSGGGAFDWEGNLVGICSFKAGGPNTAFYVPVSSIKDFLLKALL
jgi:S1-C subfamily serine protease